MAKNIQDLRREAGYRSAKDFAAAIGIPASTYNRYEAQPDAIPLRQAWAIADFLGCSIDMVVGREPVSAEDMRGDAQKFYDGL
ncbi:MAG: helix-turn-helix transcriptional regulator [Atopobiaceae bacterium]|nr:helix-turn-helix transcriptional regulator [Atopobiaceae bacterium]